MTAVRLPTECMDVIPEWREGMGSLGSRTLELSGGTDRVFGAIVGCLADRFRKSFYDIARGIALFMAPSAMHERSARGALELVQALCECVGLAVVPMGAATARTADDSAAADPDESFFIGPRAERFLRIQQADGLDAAVAEMGNAPRDLVIEVEHTRRNTAKRLVYRDAGIGELWELATGASGRAPAIWDLQAGDAPQRVDRSRVLPGARASALPAALTELRRIGGLVALVRRVAQGESIDAELMAAVGMSRGPGSRTEESQP